MVLPVAEKHTISVALPQDSSKSQIFICVLAFNLVKAKETLSVKSVKYSISNTKTI